MTGSGSNHIQRAGDELSDLLNLLYAFPPSPDIVTLEDVLTRYRLTRLGVPAITALQQARRIVRAGKDYCQIGLCEFHIGLIYLHWQHCLAAAQQFAEARRQWLFADETASVCLTYFAEGQAQRYALHYEPAMGCYHQTEQWLPRLRLTPPSAKLDEFVLKITAMLRESQESLRNQMWPPEEMEQTAESPPPEAETAEAAPEAETAESPPPTGEAPEAETAERVVPRPRINIVHEQVTPEMPPAEFSSLPVASLPAVRLEAAEPASVVLPIKEYYKWFHVVKRQGNDLPSIRKGTWLLVDTQLRERYERNDLILIGSDNDEFRGNIQVEPYITPPVYKRIVLRRIPTDIDELPFTRDSAGRVEIKLPSMTSVIGVVLGFWFNPFQAGLEAGQPVEN